MLTSICKLVEARGLARPDGRPLYAYKVTDAELREVERELRKDVQVHTGLHRDASAAFCLYGAEYFSRGDGSDWWTYDGLTKVLPLELHEQELRDAIAAGLEFWKRRVLPSGRGQEYLATLVSEGGLPLALLQKEGGSLRGYFGDLLRQHETYPTLDVTTLAADIAGSLPMRMQNSVVYTLAAALVRHVAYLRDPGVGPEGAAKWPAPLRLDSEAARELLAGLRSAPRSRADVEPGIVVKTTLDVATGPLLRRQLVLPLKVSRDWLAEVIPGFTEPPMRWHLSLVTPVGTRTTMGVAMLQGDAYVLTPLAARDIVRPETVTEQLQCVVSAGGVDVGAFVPRGGEALSDTPWSFSDGDRGAVLRATGSWRSSAPSLLAVLPPAASFKIQGDGAAEVLGELVGLKRALVRVRGTLRVTHGGDETVVASGAEGEAECAFELRGTRVSQLARDADVWLGRPRVVVLDDHEVLRNVPTDCLRWRSAGGAWTPDLDQALGKGELAATHDGHEFRTRLRILPADLRLSVRCGGPDRGTLELRSAQLQAAGLLPSNRYNITVRRVAGGFDLELAAAPGGDVPATVLVDLRFGSGSELSIHAPFPREQVGFIDREGRALRRDSTISLDDLAHVRAVAISPITKASWTVDLRAPGHDNIGLATLPDRGGGMREMSLEPLRPVISAALATSSSLDYAVQLRLEAAGVVGAICACWVRRYGAILRPETCGEEHSVALAPDDASRFGDAVLAALRAEAVPFLEPDRTATALRAVAPGRWSLDGGLAPGPWLILVYQSEYLRTRPLRITVKPPDAQPVAIGTNDPASPSDDDQIMRAMQVANPIDRGEALDASITALGDDTAAPGWKTVQKILSTLGRYPAGTFDVVRSITRCPRVAVLSLLDAGPNAGTLWASLEELPFLWATIPTAAWIEASQRWHRSLRSRLRTWTEDAFAHFVANAAPFVFGGRRLAPFLGCIHDAVFLIEPAVPDPRDRWVFSLREPAARAQAGSLRGFGGVSPLADHRRELLLGHIEGHWPVAPPFDTVDTGPELRSMAQSTTSDQPARKHTVLKTPLILAERAVAGDTSCDLLRLRQIRDFDPEWFDFAFALALGILLGTRYERREAPFDE